MQQRQADEAPLAECPECHDYFPTLGPDGLLPHIVGDHRESELARYVLSEMERDVRPRPRIMWGYLCFWVFYLLGVAYLIAQIVRAFLR